MSDLTLGEVGKQLIVALYTIDQTQNPPAQVPLNLTNAAVTLQWAISDPNYRTKAPDKVVTMGIINIDGDGPVLGAGAAQR